MKKIILAQLFFSLLTGCGYSVVKLENTVGVLEGHWKSDCLVFGVNSAMMSVTLEKVSSVVFNSRAVISSYNQNNCTGSVIEMDANGQPLPPSGIGPVTDIATIVPLLPGMPDKYILISNQPLGINGSPNGPPAYQVLYHANNKLYILIIGPAVTGTTWDEWKTSSTVVAQFEADPEVLSDDGNNTNNAKLTRQ